jgi:hypothetical protein
MSRQDWKTHALEAQFNPRTELGAKIDDVLASWKAKSEGARSH